MHILHDQLQPDRLRKNELTLYSDARERYTFSRGLPCRRWKQATKQLSKRSRSPLVTLLRSCRCDLPAVCAAIVTFLGPLG